MSKILSAAELRSTRAGAKTTILKLIAVHRSTIASIDAGHVFWKNGQDVSQEIKKRCEYEIASCMHVLDAIDHMKAGDIKRAADLCSEIQAHLPAIN